ncbi:MAG: MBL fold metallo-hydrolase [Geminicoccaceae bacterium]
MSRSLTVPAIVLSLVMAFMPSTTFARGCFPLAEREAGFRLASLQLSAIPAGKTVEISYLGHSSFRIETREGVRAVTDYHGFHGTGDLPGIVTMNNAHSTHYTPFPDPAIEHVLKGWGENNGMAVHDVEVGDLRVRNIPTSVHGRVGAQANSNSIFVFEMEDLCVAHLGHLHHVLTDTHLGELGVIDILFVPIDGAYTMSQQEMALVVQQIRPKIVIPMHFFGPQAAERFAALLGDEWPMQEIASGRIALSRTDLGQSRFLVLSPGPG